MQRGAEIVVAVSLRVRAAGVATMLVLTLAAPARTHAASCAGTVYLTFDTGNMAQAEVIAQTLREEHVRATFFIANERTPRNDTALDPAWQDYWRARVAEGHAFGNHTWSHHYQRRDEGERVVAVSVAGRTVQLDRTAFCAELKQVDAAFVRLTGRHLSGMWRAPGGRTTQHSIRWAASCGYPVYVGWPDAGYIGDDQPSETQPNDVLVKRALKAIVPGDVIALHLGVWSRREPFAPALKPLIQGLKARGLCFGLLDAVNR